MSQGGGYPRRSAKPDPVRTTRMLFKDTSSHCGPYTYWLRICIITRPWGVGAIKRPPITLLIRMANPAHTQKETMSAQERDKITRRTFARNLMLGTVGSRAFVPGLKLLNRPSRKRRVAVMSDIHVGRRANELDGEKWLERSFEDLGKNVSPIQYGLTLGDITHHGDRRSLIRYLNLRDKSHIPRWFELAGNHEHRNGGVAHYRRLIGEIAPYCITDGNIAWFFLSDEWKRVPGNMSTRSYRWLKENLERHRDKIIIFCSHQIPPNTTGRSGEDMFCLHPRNLITDLFERFPIALSLFGHEHHGPYTRNHMIRKHNTTYINAASTSHAYGTQMSASLVLELEDNRREIVARRRNHDWNKFLDEFEFKIPLPKPIRLGRQ